MTAESAADFRPLRQVPRKKTSAKIVEYLDVSDQKSEVRGGNWEMETRPRVSTLPHASRSARTRA
ncbi:MAG: hypothetical protein DME27_06485 [Verrucomicrobia bacterium]|nr:MAG: hypothetical protein DME27_06485 [Verrucomicrobiota bacterium]